MSNIKKRILIYHNLPSGGAKLTFLSTANYLKKRYKTVQFAEPKYEISNILQYLYVSLITSQRYQKRIINGTKHDILLAYQSWLVNTPSVIRYSRKPKIYICHESMREYYDIQHKKTQSFKDKIVNIVRLPIKYLDSINIKAKNTIIVANSHLSKKIIDKTYGVNCRVVYPGIETNKYKASKVMEKKNQVICIGAINKLKNQEFLIDVISKIKQNNRPTLVLIGNGANNQYLTYLKEKAKILSVKIKIKINVSDKEKISELWKSKVFMYSPISEPFGIVVVEALAAGLPIITHSSGGGYNEVIDSRNGVIIDSINPFTWSNSLVSLISNPDLINKYQKYNTRYASRYLDSKKMNKQILELINNLI